VVKQAVVPETPIVLGVSFEPEYFSPDGDGENDILSIILTVAGGEAASWSFDILQPAPANAQSHARVFKHFEGAGAPTEAILWDGRSDPDSATGRSTRVMSATDYPYVFTVIDAQGVVSGSMNGVICVDVLVIREDDGRLRIQIPSIVFRTNAEDFKDLPERTVTNNERVIRRIAFILNKVPAYKVRVEGHANPESVPGTKARANEEKRERASNSVSEKRAKAIVDMLIQDGVAKDRLTAVGLGISKPITEFEDRDNWWKNRRVEFYLEKE
jgi:outer membrane protein OmpA-like peptidoglycan-associated protein